MRLDIDEGARRWLIKTARKNFWRVSMWYDLDDLIQDGYIFYYRTLERYPGLENRAHVMSLFKRSYTNYLHDMSRRHVYDVMHQTMCRRVDEVRACDLVRVETTGDYSDLWEKIGAVDSDQHMRDLLASAPTTLQQVLRLFADERTRKKLCAPYKARKNGSRETFNERLCRLAGIDARGVDIAGTLRSYLHSHS